MEKFQNTTRQMLHKMFQLLFSLEFSIITIFRWVLHSCYSEGANLTSGLVFVGDLGGGQQLLWGCWREPPGRGFYTCRRCFISFIKHLPRTKIAGPWWNLLEHLSRWSFLWLLSMGRLLWYFSLLIPETKSSPRSEKKASRFLNEGPSGEDFSVFDSLSVQIYR